jgi:hypothetical protein
MTMFIHQATTDMNGEEKKDAHLEPLGARLPDLQHTCSIRIYRLSITFNSNARRLSCESED